MTFAFHDANVYSALQTTNWLRPKLLKFWRMFLLTIGSIAFVLYGIQQIEHAASLTAALPLNGATALGIALLAVPAGVTIGFFEIFLSLVIRRPPAANAENVAEYFELSAARAFLRAENIAQSANLPAIPPDVLLAGIINEPAARPIFVRLGIDANELSDALRVSPSLNLNRIVHLDIQIPPSDDLLEVLAGAFAAMRRHRAKRISLMDLLVALADTSKPLQQRLIDRGLDAKDLNLLALWYESNDRYRERERRFWSLENLIRKPPIGAGWSYGYTPLLNHFAANVTRPFREGRAEITLIGRDVVINQTEEILARSGKNNVLLVGEEGVGKNAVILGFAQMIARGKSLPALNQKQVVKLNMSLLTASSEQPAEVRSTILSTLQETAKAGNIIIVIERLHNVVNGSGEISGAELMELLLPFISSPDIQVIATTDPPSFHREISPRGEILDVFEKVEVREPGLEETMQIVHQVIPRIEHDSGLLITYAAIKASVEGAQQYIQTVPFPEKAINLLAEVVSAAQARGKKTVRLDDVNSVITRKTNIPTGAVGKNEKKKLMNLEEIMHRDIVGQDNAVTAVAQTLRRLRAGLTAGDRPAGVFLFVGPTGVGKTLTAKTLARAYFGSKDRMIRFDMSEYQHADGIGRFLGSLELNQPGQLVTVVRDNPFSVILLDEFEKADRSIINLFLQIFDEGHVTDVFGRKVNFEQSIIIATSNAAAPEIIDMIKQGIDPSSQKETVTNLLITDGHLAPELLNRFDEIVVFHPLSQNDLHHIARLLLNDLSARLKDQGYLFQPSEELAAHLVTIGYEPQFGARPMRRALQNTAEALIAKRILDGNIVKGTPFTIHPSDINHDQDRAE